MAVHSQQICLDFTHPIHKSKTSHSRSSSSLLVVGQFPGSPIWQPTTPAAASVGAAPFSALQVLFCCRYNPSFTKRILSSYCGSNQWAPHWAFRNSEASQLAAEQMDKLIAIRKKRSTSAKQSLELLRLAQFDHLVKCDSHLQSKQNKTITQVGDMDNLPTPSLQMVDQQVC